MMVMWIVTQLMLLLLVSVVKRVHSTSNVRYTEYECTYVYRDINDGDMNFLMHIVIFKK